MNEQTTNNFTLFILFAYGNEFQRIIFKYSGYLKNAKKIIFYNKDPSVLHLNRIAEATYNKRFKIYVVLHHVSTHLPYIQLCWVTKKYKEVHKSQFPLKSIIYIYYCGYEHKDRISY